MNEIILRSKKIPQEVPVVTVGEFLISKFNKLPDKTCIVDFKTGNELTTKQLIDNSERLAVSLLNKGIVKSDVFMCFSQNNLQYAITEFAFFLLGNTFTPVNPINGVFELKNQIRNSGTTVIFTSVLNANKVKKILNDKNNNEEDLKNQIKFVVVFDGKFDDFLTFDELINESKPEKLERIPFFEVNPKEDLVTIVYTSGTTGLPKGAMITHYGFVASLIDGIVISKSEDFTQTMSCMYPCGHVSGTFVLPYMTSIGQKVVIYESINDDDILKSVDKYKINFLTISQSLGYRLMDDNLKYDISSVKLMSTGGSKFPNNIIKGLIEKFGIIFRQGYGMTEYLNPLSSISAPLGSVGSVLPDTELKFIDLTTGQSLGPNIDGEICVRGPKMFKGYLNNEKATKEAIDSNGWYHTGDIGHYDQNQFVYITDRLKELIKYKSWSVAPAEIEAFLQTHESVESVAVIGVNHKTDGQLPRAFVKVKNGHKVDEQELINAVRENMGFQRQLRGGIVFMDEMPKTIIGKVDRQFFKKLVEKEMLE